jgi:hypothetical protein
MAEHKYKLEYVFIDLSDNDFYFAMCDFAESLIRMFERGDFTVEKCKDNVKETFPRMMSCLCHLDEYESGKPEEMKRHEEYFAEQSTYLFDFDEIKGYMKEHAMLYDEHDADWNFDYRYAYPDAWLSQLDINLNAEVILIQFVSTKSGKPEKGKSSYRIF